jgi:hypothetical protein
MSHIFPKWLYHKTLKPEGFICRSAEEFSHLGDGWVDSPLKFAADVETEPAEGQPAETYREHMAKWESKQEKAEPKRGRQRKA